MEEEVLKKRVQRIYNLAFELTVARLNLEDSKIETLICEAFLNILPYKEEDRNASKIRRFLEEELPPILDGFFKTNGTAQQRHRANNAVASMIRATEHLSYLITQEELWWK